MASTKDALTVVIPTRNRSHLCASLIQYLRRCGLDYAIIVAASSDPDQAQPLDTACRAANASHHYYHPDTEICRKILDALERVRTPLVVMLPDDDIALPHALEQCASFLQQNPDVAAAWGYVLDYGMRDEQIDIFRVRWFTPSVSESSPFERAYHLIRRYQPFFWAVFWTGTLVESIKQGRDAGRILYQELTIMLTTILQGKVARLPIVYALRSDEPCSYGREKVMPLHAFIDNAAAVFQEYAVYRNRMVSFVRDHLGESAEKQLHDCTIEHFFDLLHGIGLARELDPGPLNYTVQRALGAPYPPIPLEQGTHVWTEPSDGDVVHPSSLGKRRYIWRDAVLNAEPKSEITIATDEIARVEKAIENYSI